MIENRCFQLTWYNLGQPAQLPTQYNRFDRKNKSKEIKDFNESPFNGVKYCCNKIRALMKGLH